MWHRFSSALQDLRRSWVQLLLTDLLARALAAVILVPAVGLLLQLFLLVTGAGVLTDAGIVSFLLHPIGLVGMILLAALFLAILLLEQGALMAIGFGAAGGAAIPFRSALRYGGRSAIRVASLGIHGLVRLALIAAPFLAAAVLVNLHLLGDHDINYYLQRRPPEFRTAALLTATLLGAMALVLAWKFISWVLALPVVLFGGEGGSAALRVSARATKGHRVVLMAWLIGWFIVPLLASALLSFVAALIGNRLLADVDRLWSMAAGLALVMLIGGGGTLAVMLFATLISPLFVVRLYRDLAGPGRWDPAVPVGRSSRVEAGRRRRASLLAGAGLAGVTVIAVSYAAIERMDAEDETRVIAHRGASASAPENTIAAFERAIADGADWIELDVQENADGTVVVQHDNDFMRVAGVSLKIWKATDEHLSRLDVGSFFSDEFADQRVPTLRQVLELAHGRIGVLIELKYYGHDQNLVAKVVDLVEATGMESSIEVMSLQQSLVGQVGTLRPGWTRGLLATVGIGDMTRLDMGFLALNAVTATRARIRRAHRRGMKVYVWTVNEPVQMSVMISRGADGLITDEPDRARELLQLREHLGPFGRPLVWAAGETGFLRGVSDSSGAEDA